MIFKHFLMDTFGEEGGGGDTTTETTTEPNVNNSQDYKWPEDWKTHLSEELRSEKSLDTVADIPSLAKSFVHAQKMVGANKAIVPDPKLATDQDWKDFYMKAGLPDKFEDYKMEIKDADAMPENFLENFSQKAHELNIMPAQAKAMLEWYREWETGFVSDQNDAVQADLEKGLDGYRKVMGQAYERDIANANKVIEEYGSQELSELLQESGFSKQPEILKIFGAIGKKLYGEDTVLGEDKRATGALSPEEATGKIQDIQGDKSHPYWNGAHPNHKRAVDEVQKLYSFVHGAVDAL